MILPICLECKHQLISGTCEAFPEGIPDEIWNGRNNHDDPLPEQDNEIVFEPIK